MKSVTIYTGPLCNFCDAAKRLLTRNNVEYKEINIATVDGAMDEMIKKANGKRTIPQIFFDDQHIGGYDEARALEKENKLQELFPDLYLMPAAFNSSSDFPTHATSGEV